MTYRVKRKEEKTHKIFKKSFLVGDGGGGSLNSGLCRFIIFISIKQCGLFLSLTHYQVHISRFGGIIRGNSLEMVELQSFCSFLYYAEISSVSWHASYGVKIGIASILIIRDNYVTIQLLFLSVLFHDEISKALH